VAVSVEDIVFTTCPRLGCGVRFGIPSHIYRQCMSVGDKRTVYCPNGHAFGWTVTEEERLRKQLAAVECDRDAYSNRTAKLERQVAALKGVITKLCGRLK